MTVQRLLKKFSQDSTAVRMNPALDAAVDPKRAPTMKIDRAAQPSTDKALQDAFPEQKSRGWMVIVALVLLLAIGLGVKFLGGKPELQPEVIAETVPVEPRVIAPVVVVPPPEPVKPPPELDPVVPLPKLPKPPAPVVQRPAVVVQAPRPCTFDDRFREYARRTRADLRTMGKPDALEFVRVDDRLAGALIERDCQRVNAALDDMRRLVGAPIE